ncbi:MAG TPA: hypothetical protein VGR54_07730 [Nitrosopumilaceae archaeon]|nr:hypothetical protein [Nitrosopumilaceae archaeon]
MRTRRGLSSVVGTVFAIIALSTTIAYVSYSMNILDKYNQTVLGTNQQSLDTSKEKFQVTGVTFVNNKFNITVTNTGSLPINFTKLWVQNTTATDWTSSFAPRTKVVSPGGILYNIGQNIPLSALSTNAYHIKLVTSRGNTQEFNVNSASSAPLNIQLFALPASVNTGFKSELVMIVTNNGSSILTNISPSVLPSTTGIATCAASSASPARYNTLLPGSTAVFKWDVTVSGANGQTCTYTLNQPLQNGYVQTVQATITVNVITFTQTNLAQNTGILTLNYSTFRWTQGTGWNTGWSFPFTNPTAFSVQVTNNNSTGDFYVSSYSQFAFQPNVGGENNTPFYIAYAVTPSLSITAYTCSSPNEYCIKIPAGTTTTLYFAVKTRQNIDTNKLTSAIQWSNSMLMFGKFSTSQTAPGTFYAQTIPFLAVQTT